MLQFKLSAVNGDYGGSDPGGAVRGFDAGMCIDTGGTCSLIRMQDIVL